jgi:phosphoglycerate dehydrogenase-like enzyme
LAKNKLIFITNSIETDAWDVFCAHALPDFEIELVKPSDGQDKFKEKAESSDFMVVFRSGLIRSEIIEKANHLKFIQSTSQGMDHVPIRTAVQKGIYVANINGGNAIAVAELAVLLMLSVMRRLVTTVEDCRQSTTKADFRVYRQLYGKTVGLVGFGNIARYTAKMVSGFDTNVLVYRQSEAPEALMKEYNARQVGLEYLLKNSDIISLHTPLTESTKHLIGWEQFTMMKPDAFLINTARGAVVDEQALIRALREKIIAGAGLDVFEHEPPKQDNPLLHMENVVATNHIGGVSWDNWEPRMKFIWNNIKRVMEGQEPINSLRI